jgi:hypothetical protein
MHVLLITVMCNWFRITSFVTKFHSLHSFTSFQSQSVLYLFIQIVYIPPQTHVDLLYFQIILFVEESNILAYYAAFTAEQLRTSWQTYIQSTECHIPYKPNDQQHRS